MNLAPGEALSARAMTTFNADSSQLFNPVIPAMIAGIVWVLAAAFWLGKKERQRLGVIELEDTCTRVYRTCSCSRSKRTTAFRFNLALAIFAAYRVN